MSTNLPTQAQIDRAEPLEFADRQPETQITIHAALDGWPIDIAYRGKLEQLPAAIKRLTDAGLMPAQTTVTTAAQKPAKSRQKRVEPIYQPDGTACCPTHKKPLRDGQWGLHCTAKDDGPDSKNGYCGLKFAE